MRPAIALSILLAALSPSFAVAQERGAKEHRRLSDLVKAAAGRGANEALDQACDLLIEEDTPRVVDVLLGLTIEHPEQWYPYELAKYHLAYSLKHPASALHMADQLRKHRDAKVRIALADAVSLRDDETTGQALDDAVRDKDDRVARMAVRGVRYRRRVSAVEPLIERLAGLLRDRRGETALLNDVEVALLRITGEQFGSAAEWTSFWAARGQGFVPPADVERRLESTRARPRFFGDDLRSDRVVFVVDVSSSMLHGEPSRIERTKRALTDLVAGLPDGARFALVAYSGVLYETGLPADAPATGPLPEVLGGERWLWHTGAKLLDASSRRKEAVTRFLEELEATGSTFTLEALRYAMTIEGADLIVLLSDGQPEEVDRSRNAYYTEDQLLAEFSRINRFACRRVDTFGLGGAGDEFLRRLAEQTGGTFNSID